ncbi:MAG: HEAT repeat domain-containing protein, partial [Spirulina sp.]
MADYSIDRCRESMVRILKCDRASTAGSGFIIREDGYLITCHHVIYQLECLCVEYQNKQYEAQWCEEYSDPDVDIAILKIEVQQATAVPIINPSQLETSVTVYGFPPKQEKYFPKGYSVSSREIQASAPLKVLATYGNRTVTSDRPWNLLPRSQATFRSHRIDTKVDPGTSGGAVIAEDLGGVVGVIQCSKSDESYCIRWDNLTRQLEQLNLEPKQQVIRQFLEDIEEKVKYLRLFHVPQERILLQEQYIDIQVTLERKFKHEVETMRSYAESETDNRRIYALKGMREEKERTQVDWQEARKEHQRMVVLADPGMGKSTLLKQEALTVIARAKEQLEGNEKTEKIVIPLLFRLSKLAESKKTILERIFELLREEYGEQWQEWDRRVSFESLLREKLQAGTCLLLLDALDEVPKEQRLDLKERLNRFAKQYPCAMILTSRIVGYDGSFVNVGKDVEIVPFGQEQTRKYIEYWFKNAESYLQDEKVSTEGLIAELEQKPQIQGLVQNPLLLSLLCSLYQTKGLILPARRTQVYQQAVNYMLKDWSRENERRLQQEGWVLAKIELLEFLAYRISCQNKEIFRLEDVRESLRDYLEDGKAIDFQQVTIADLLEELTEEDGIIQKRSRDGDEYLFLHRTFQEYLTAAYLKREIVEDCDRGIALVKAHLWEYDWHETISLVVGLLDEPIPLLQSILREKDDIFKTLLLLAGSCIVECQSFSHPLIAKIIDQIGQFWRSYPNAEFIESVLIALGKIEHLQVIELLIAALNDSDGDVRWRAAEGLGKIGNERAVEALIAALNHPNESVRESAAKMLKEIDNKIAVEALIAALNDSNRWVRGSAAKMLKEIDNERAVEPLIAALNHPNEWVRGIAAEELGKIGNERAVEALIAALHDSDESVRWSAVYGLGKIGNERAVEPLIAALNDSDELVRVSAAEGLGKIGNERAVEPLIAALNDSNELVRVSAAVE